jgi:hypothetical protein
LNPKTLQQFSYDSYLPQEIIAGKVHVSVGFVDLCSLIWSTPAIYESMQYSQSPIEWIGYEASPFCVAKTMVIAEMLRNGSLVESIVQVWFSSIWRIATLKDFTVSLKTIIEKH